MPEDWNLGELLSASVPGDSNWNLDNVLGSTVPEERDWNMDDILSSSITDTFLDSNDLSMDWCERTSWAEEMYLDTFTAHT